ncbi:MAG: spore maturation protein [Firmicutes bacterium]|nr:spore maturation protein [Bacillota bacterium]MBQ5796710.1 spore maturation protein [Bacillota bacterium]MBR5000872.1 spore maturation protein [Bacillota bacterium]MBR6500077.1 spore maturation protein [Bacillota bacterium]
MNYIWAGMMVIGIAFSAVNGTMDTLGDAMMDSCEESITFLLSMAGVMGLWSGIMNIAEKTGLIHALCGLFRPLTAWLFPQVKDEETISAMILSFASNMMGAGNSSTIFALKAMERLDRENGRRPVASDAMCMFLVINMYMVQLLPVTVLKLRSDAGSAAPEDIVIPAAIVELVTMVAAVILCRICEGKRGKHLR